MTHKFYDTCSLLLKAGHVFDEQDSILVISSITLEELESIKTSSRKDNDVKFAARKLTHELDEHFGEYEIITFVPSLLEYPPFSQMEVTNDLKIIACAFTAYELWNDLIFITNDLCCKNLALSILTCPVEKYTANKSDYTGYKIIPLTEKQLLEFYENTTKNFYDLYIGQYLILEDSEGNILDIRCWTGKDHRYINTKPIDSKWFGKISPYNGDTLQKLAIDSLYNNQLTVLRGPAGTGKSILGLSFLFSLLEHHTIDRIYIFCNPVATKDAAKLGFYPGDKNMKLLDSQIGNFLIGKFGDYTAVERLINDEQIILIPAADCRGMDITNNSGVYITEAQNSTIDMMKLMIQRIGENTKCVIEGDDKSQVDLISYEGANNGLSRLSEVFKGQPYYGEITLSNCYRSKIAFKAQEM